MKIKNKDSLINSTMLDSNKYSHDNNDIHINNTNYNDKLVEYRHRHNRFVSESMNQNILSQSTLPDNDIKAFEYALRNSTIGDVSTIRKRLYNHGLLLESQLANPNAYACYPIPDKLHFTVDLTPEELEYFHLHYKTIFNNSLFKFSTAKYKRQNGQFHKTKIVFRLKNRSTSEIHVFLGDNAEQRKTQHNLLRIEVIPARFTPKELKDFFNTIKCANFIKNYEIKMNNAKISRCDIAIDFIGIPLPLFIADKPNIKNFSNHSKHELKNLPFVQTINIGNIRDSHSVVYAKTEKLIESSSSKSKHPLPMVINDDGNPIAVTRYEHVYRPQQSGTSLRLCDLCNMGNIFKSVAIYRPDILSYFDTATQEKSLKNGLMISIKEKYSEIEFKNRKNILQRHAFFINREQFKLLQEKILKKLSKCVIFPDK